MTTRPQIDTMPLRGGSANCEHRGGWLRSCAPRPGDPGELQNPPEARTHGDVRWIECTRCGEIWQEEVEH